MILSLLIGNGNAPTHGPVGGRMDATYRLLKMHLLFETKMPPTFFCYLTARLPTVGPLGTY